MALYGMTQRNDAAPSAPTSTYGGMFARNDAPTASAPSAPQASQTGYGRYGSRPQQSSGAGQGSQLGGTRGGWSSGWGQPQATGPRLPDPKIDYDQRVQFNTPQQRMNVTGWGQGSAAQGAYATPSQPANMNRGYSQDAADFLTGGPFNSQMGNLANRQPAPSQSGGPALANATNWANQMNAASPSPSVMPGIKSGPDEYGGAPSQTPSVQFNTPWQRLGVSGYGQGNATQGAYSEQTGQQGSPQPTSMAALQPFRIDPPPTPASSPSQPLPQWANVPGASQYVPQPVQQAMPQPARTLPAQLPSPFGGISYGQPQPDPGVGNYGAASVPQGMSSRYARPQLMRTLY